MRRHARPEGQRGGPMADAALLGRVVAETNRIVDGIQPDQLGNSTPCSEWTVRDLLNHLSGGATMFALSAEQGSVPDDEVARLMGDTLGDDYRGAVRTAAERAVTAFEQPGVMEKTVTLPFGQMPAQVALDIAVFDVTTHAVDLARSTGQPAPEGDLLETALAIGQQMIGPDMRRPGVFDAEVTVDSDAPVADRLLAFAGRKV